MSLIPQANRGGAPLIGQQGPLGQAGPALGGNQARPASTAFEQAGAKAGGGGQPAGEKALSKEQKEALERQEKISEALDKNDIGALRGLAKDPKAMAAATPDQKAAVLNALCKDVNANGKGNLEDREGIVSLLGSAHGDAEYQALMQAANPDLVKEAMTLGAGENGGNALIAPLLNGVDKKLATSFDIMAGAHGCSACALSPENAVMAERARARGYTADQIVAARRKSVSAMGDDDRVKGAADDPLAMMVTTPAEKSAMLRELIDGWTTDSEDRAMVSILESCEDKAEFDQVIDGAGGRGVVDELDDDEAKKKANQLCGAYERMDCATDPKTAQAAYGDLTNPARVTHLLDGADGEVVRPEAQPRSGDLGDDYIRQSQADLAAKAATLDRRALVETVLANSDREAHGQPLFDPRAVRGDVAAVMNDPSLEDGEKEKKIEELRKREQLTGYTMRNIATQPLARIYEDQTRQAAQFAAVGNQLEQQRAMQMMARFGADSPQALLALQAAARFQQEMTGYVGSLQGSAKKLEDLYPPPKGFWEGALSFLGDLAKTVAPALLNLIPGVGTALYAGYEIAKTVWDAAHGNWLGALTDVAGVLPGVGGTVGEIASAAIKGGVGLEQAIEHGDWTAGLGAIASATGSVAGATGSPAVQDIADMAKDAALVARGIKTGDFSSILAGAGDLAGLDPQTRQLIQGGAGTLQAFARGDAANALSSLSNALGRFDDPVARELSTLALQGSRFTQALQTGDLGAALTGTEDLARQLGAGPAVDALTQALAPLSKIGLNEQNASAVIDLVKALGKGDAGAALGDAQGLVQRLGGGPALDRIKEIVAPFEDAGLNGPNARAVLDFAKAVAGGDVGQALQTIGAQAGRLTNSPELKKAMGFVNDGAGLVSALQRGQFSTAMETLGLPARDVGAVRQAETLLRSLQNGDLDALARTDPARQLLQSAQSLAQELGGGQALDAIHRFSAALQQLRSATTPGFDQALVAQANQLLAQAARG